MNSSDLIHVAFGAFLGLVSGIILTLVRTGRESEGRRRENRENDARAAYEDLAPKLFRTIGFADDCRQDTRTREFLLDRRMEFARSLEELQPSIFVHQSRFPLVLGDTLQDLFETAWEFDLVLRKALGNGDSVAPVYPLWDRLKALEEDFSKQLAEYLDGGVPMRHTLGTLKRPAQTL